jgi:hypothetical protein
MQIPDLPLLPEGHPVHGLIDTAAALLPMLTGRAGPLPLTGPVERLAMSGDPTETACSITYGHMPVSADFRRQAVSRGR